MSSLNSGKVWFSSHLPYRLHPVNVPITWDPPSVFIARAKVVIFSTPVYTNIVWYFYIRRCGKRLKSVHTCTSTEYRIYLVQFPPTLILSLIGLLPVHCTRASSSCCLNSNGAGLGSVTFEYRTTEHRAPCTLAQFSPLSHCRQATSGWV